VSGGLATQVTKDHSVVQLLVDRGEITGAEAQVHPERRYITKAVGVQPEVQADYQELEFDEGDIYLLCSDGLSNYLDVEEMPRWWPPACKSAPRSRSSTTPTARAGGIISPPSSSLNKREVPQQWINI
jgi:hypothetical protein